MSRAFVHTRVLFHFFLPVLCFLVAAFVISSFCLMLFHLLVISHGFISSFFFVFSRDVFFAFSPGVIHASGQKKTKWHKPAKIQKWTANFVAEQTGCWVGIYIFTVRLPYTYTLVVSPCGYTDRLESLTPIR